MTTRSGPLTRETNAVALGLAQIRVGSSSAHIADNTPALTSSDSIGALANTKYTGSTDFWKLESGFPLLEDLSIPMREASMLECAFKELSSYNLALARGLDPKAAVDASVTVVGSSTALGTTGATPITVTNAGGVTTETWTVAFTGATAGSIWGSVSGNVHTFSAVSSIIAPDNDGAPYFSIPANFFTDTWADGDTYTFKTTAYAAAGAGYSAWNEGTINLGGLAAPAFVRMEAVYTYPNKTNTMTIIFPRANAVSNMEIDLQAEDAAAVPLTFEAKRSDSDVSGGHSVWNEAPLGLIVFA